MILHIDVETFNEAPITVGTARYCESVELMVISWAVDDGPIEVLDLTAGADYPPSFADAWWRADCVVAHNAFFDRSVLATKGIARPLSQWHCTQAQALAHSLPGSLDKLSEIYQLGDAAKSKEGKALIQLFCKPRPKTSKIRRATRETHPAEWQKFLNYAGQDIVALRALHKKLPTWNCTAAEREAWLLHETINDRGFAVDLDLAEQAVALGARVKASLQDRTAEITGTDLSVAQRDALLAHLLAEYGVSLPDMQAATLERRIEDETLPEPARELLQIRLFATKTSNAKWSKLLASVSSDGRLRGTAKFCGASRTGRISGSLFQPLNLPRPPKALKKEIPTGVAAIKAGVADLIYDNPLDVASACLRGAIVAAPGKKLCVADLNAIEGRITAWHAGEQWALDAYKAFDRGVGHEMYTMQYAQTFGVTPEAVLANEAEGGIWRQMGKVLVLLCGFGGSVKAVQKGLALYGLSLTEEEILRAVKAYRRANKRTQDYWYALEDAVKSIITTVGGFTTFQKLEIKKSGSWLRIILPSGRSLSYASPKLEPNDRGGYDIMFYGVNNYTRKWELMKTYGGRLTENVVQATARDLLVENEFIIEDAGHEIVMTCYDEAVTEVPDDDRYSAKQLTQLLSTVPHWAPGLPLAAGGFETQRYYKG